MANAKNTAPKSKLYGASFLVGTTKPEEVFTPEDFTEEQHMIYDMVKDFCLKEIHGLGIERVALMDASKDMDTILEIFHKAAELGLCGVSIGNEYGGMDLDFTTGIIFSEVISLGFSFATTIGAQTSIGSLPIVYYGTEAQKQQYLPGIASGDLKASYCLTEPGAGSDANSGKSNAVLNKEGTHYLLNGQKMWITNGGFADIFIVFAKINDDKDLSAFIVEKGFGGIELGKEEKKLGIKASSTVQVYFNNCPVPKENLLGEREGGFKMALNILNTGRIKLAAGSLGGVKFALEKSVEYATQRIQFEKPISEFGAMQHKIGEMATDAFAIESAVYRVAKNIEDKYKELKEAGSSENDAKINSIREYAIECAILKVVGSEAVGRATDEAIQIFGGMGYSMETGIEMGYRDARITRIYEGTNEINRMLSVGELMKRGFKTKEIDLMKASSGLPMDILRTTIPVRIGGGEFAQEEDIVNNIKNLFLVISAMAGRKLKLKLIDEQEIIINFADILAEAYIAESALLRVQKLTAASSDKEKLAAQKTMLQLYLYEALARAKKAGFDAINSYASGAERFLMRRVLDVLTRPYDVNPKELRRQAAQAAIKKGGYPS